MDGAIIRDEATDIAKKLGISDFNCSEGWLSKFKKRNEIKSRTFKGEKLSADHEAATKWIENDLPRLLRKYKLSDIYNCDETGLYIRGLHNKAYVPANAENFGGKVQKDRISALLCCNLDGSDKLKPLLIGKSKKPRGFPQNFETSKQFPVHWTYSSKAWMTGPIFKH